MHVKSDIDTDALLPRVESCFANPPPRGVTNIFGKPGKIRRDALWFGRYDQNGFVPLYRTFSTAYAHLHDPVSTVRGMDDPKPMPMPEWMSEFLDNLSIRHRLPTLNHVVLHRYLDGTDQIGPHHDKTLDMHPESSIVSVSLGAPRDFKLGKRTFEVENGDVVIIPYALNETAKHSVPARAHAGLRYSLTARTIHTFTNGTTHFVVG
jgi:hypothetical protein